MISHMNKDTAALREFRPIILAEAMFAEGYILGMLR